MKDQLLSDSYTVDIDLLRSEIDDLQTYNKLLLESMALIEERLKDLEYRVACISCKVYKCGEC